MCILLYFLYWPESRTAQPLSKPPSLCSVTWESTPLYHCSYNECAFESPFFHFHNCWGYSASGILSNSLPVWLGHPQCVMFWSWGHACFPCPHRGGVSNKFFQPWFQLETLCIKSEKNSSRLFISVLGGLWRQNFLQFLRMPLPTWPTLLTCKILIFPNTNHLLLYQHITSKIRECHLPRH